MKITLSQQQAFCLAEEFAKAIHARVVSMHLWTTDFVFHTPEAPWAKKEPDERFNEVCAAIRSIKNPDDRRNFIAHVRYLFKRIRDEKGTLPKWQDHRALVMEVNKDVVPVPWTYVPKEEVAA